LRGIETALGLRGRKISESHVKTKMFFKLMRKKKMGAEISRLGELRVQVVDP